MNDDDESYLVSAKSPTMEREKVWCKIDDKGELEYIDWQLVEKLAIQYNETPSAKRSDEMLIGKLLVLVRDKTKAEYGA